MAEKFSLKDHLFHSEKVMHLAQEIRAVYPDFDVAGFHHTVVTAFPSLELKARIAHIRMCLHQYLPADYVKAVQVILAALPPPLNEDLTDNDFGDFIYAPYNDFVAHYGCTKENLSLSLAVLKELTKRFSGEDAIRFFLNAFPQETLTELGKWVHDKNYHVRRLCSEGTRPKLPWSQKINIAVESPIALLEQLYADKTRYVTRSVANHLNDISKTHADLVLQTLKKWKEAQKQTPSEMDFIIKHALRTLVKQGDKDALAFMGFGNSQNIHLSQLKFDEKVKIGEALNFSFCVNSLESKDLIIDYVVHFQSKQGTLSNKKVHKLKTFLAVENTMIEVSKRHPFRPNMTTRQLFEGTHKVEIQINGTIFASFHFELNE
jgi:3-methyladenine DNA glycosylase AlkC